MFMSRSYPNRIPAPIAMLAPSRLQGGKLLSVVAGRSGRLAAVAGLTAVRALHAAEDLSLLYRAKPTCRIALLRPYAGTSLRHQPVILPSGSERRSCWWQQSVFYRR